MNNGAFDKLKDWANENGVAPTPAPAPPDPQPETPAAWFCAKFPRLEKRYGRAVQEVGSADKNDKEKPSVRDVSEDFLAASLGAEGTPETPTVFVAAEGRFYEYSPSTGIYIQIRESKICAALSGLLLDCARGCSTKFDMRNVEFKFRDSANLKGVIARARGILEVNQNYFESDPMEFVPCKNGMLRVSDRAVLPFSPKYRRRNKLAVEFRPGAPCPLFLGTLLAPALEPEDIDLLQRWCGLALIGVNLAQTFLILSGTAGGGKGTLVRIIVGIIGAENVGSLRPDLLGERFELGRLLGKSLLYGPDVPGNFLNCKGASVLKSITGGDLATLELKGSNERLGILCRFNAIVTCNSRLTLRLEGDADAWRRRLGIIEFLKPKTENVIADLSERILADEGPGVLNWMLDGLDKVQANGWQLRLTDAQQHVVDDLLLESEADMVFAKECLEKNGTASLTVSNCYEHYVAFCNERGWAAMARKRFSCSIADTVARIFGLTVRNDIQDASGKAQRGWKGMKCK
jgi:P4 family phage/plasmid primase-like protien